jgi:U6 snRNA-associated Sm-like protein LSm6
MSSASAAPAPPAPAAPAAAGAKRAAPADFVRGVVGRPVAVRLVSGVEYRGILVCLDGYMNVVMEQTEEFGVDGTLKNRYGDAMIRCNNVLYIGSTK